LLKKNFFVCFFLLIATLQMNAQDGFSNLEFIENKGQWDNRVMFKAELNNGAFFLQKQGFTVLLHHPDDIRSLTQNHRSERPVSGTTAKSLNPPVFGGPSAEKKDSRILRSQAYSVVFKGSSDAATILPDKPLPSYNNYFIGSDRAKWASNCRLFQGITYKNIYPNIDMRYYTSNGQMKYDIVVHPGGDISQIALKYDGVDKMTLHNNRLIVKTSVGDVQELAPYSYQVNAGGKNEITCKYQLDADNTVRFKVKDYSPASTLIIDPTLIFCSFTGSKASNWGFTATPGPDGSFYAGGIVFGDGFPTFPGVFEQNYRGGVFDVGIMKFNSTGTNRVYATYLGGSDNETPHSMFCDPQGELVVLGRTYSTDFPFLSKFGPGGNADMFVVKLNSTGSALLGSMRIGGTQDDCVNIEDQFRNDHEVAESLIKNYGDDSRSEVIMDAANNIYVAASSQSTDFPVTAGVFQPTITGKQDGVVLKIDPSCSNLIFSTYLGGSDNDAAFVLKLNPANGDIYVAGATSSTDFPGSKAGVLQPSFVGGICDAFVSIISNDGSTLKKSGFFGTPGFDAIYGIGFDRNNFPYIMGTTTGNWTVTSNAAFVNPGAKQFVAKLQPDLSAYVYSTTFGAPSPLPNISPIAFLVDRCENVYVSGWGGWLFAQSDPYGLSGTFFMPTTPDAIKKSTDGRDFYFIVIKKDASALLYGSFFGQNDGPKSISEHVDGGTSRYDANGVIYQAICANCGDNSLSRFPTTPGVWSPNNGAGSEGCNLAAVKIAFNFAGVSADINPYIHGIIDSSGCIPLTVLFSDTIRSAKSYIWNFGDGGPDTSSTSYQVTHTYNNVGFYTVRIIAIDSSSCNISDTTYVHIRANNNPATLGFNVVKLAPCQSLSYQFINTSSVSPAGPPFGPASFVWDFGDGSARVPSGPANLVHSYVSAGTYTVRLVLVDTNYCNFPDSSILTLRVAPLVKAQFITPASGCVPYTAYFQNSSLAGQLFIWDFGDGSPLVDTLSPYHTYTNIGSYTVKLIAIDSNTCNIIDSTSSVITVNPKPQASFTYSPNPPVVANKPTIFYNGSTGASHFVWFFGDGDSTPISSMDTVMHQYQKTGTFQACLVAINQFGCSDTSCMPVQTLINPLLDVPNAFTPGRFGQNSIVKVQGFGIGSLVFRIYNRWGQLVFETNNPSQGWDGTYKGNPQPMDVYAYTVDAIFFDGTKTTKKGDITLIR
jgi:gliding motility-associated-like protein